MLLLIISVQQLAEMNLKPRQQSCVALGTIGHTLKVLSTT
jgi:hypothetical protein